jgi:dihydrodipicolinate synthase/N-acetylneuraminate lyase
VLLPMADATTPDWDGLAAHAARTVDAGLTPALNMDTGYGPALSTAERDRVLALGRSMGVAFIAGCHVDDRPGDALDPDAYVAAATHVAAHGGTPILFPSHGLAAAVDDDVVALHRRVAQEVDAVLGFELGPMFHPAGRIFTTEVFTALLEIPQVVGAKHSSLRRDLEWARLRRRDELRPDFSLMTGNDLAIDLVTLGSDYLLGLSTFAPDAFAARDRAWADGDEARFWELNDVLQHLGRVAFRAPVPAYRHDAAMFLHARGWAPTPLAHPSSPTRPAWEAELLASVLDELDATLGDA